MINKMHDEEETVVESIANTVPASFEKWNGCLVSRARDTGPGGCWTW
jgi:hypothetical protein